MASAELSRSQRGRLLFPSPERLAGWAMRAPLWGAALAFLPAAAVIGCAFPAVLLAPACEPFTSPADFYFNGVWHCVRLFGPYCLLLAGTIVLVEMVSLRRCQRESFAQARACLFLLTPTVPAAPLLIWCCAAAYAAAADPAVYPVPGLVPPARGTAFRALAWVGWPVVFTAYWLVLTRAALSHLERLYEGRCRRCGYELGGVAICPECGSATAE